MSRGHTSREGTDGRYLPGREPIPTSVSQPSRLSPARSRLTTMMKFDESPEAERVRLQKFKDEYDAGLDTLKDEHLLDEEAWSRKVSKRRHTERGSVDVANIVSNAIEEYLRRK